MFMMIMHLHPFSYAVRIDHFYGDFFCGKMNKGSHFRLLDRALKSLPSMVKRHRRNPRRKCVHLLSVQSYPVILGGLFILRCVCRMDHILLPICLDIMPIIPENYTPSRCPADFSLFFRVIPKKTIYFFVFVKINHCGK